MGVSVRVRPSWGRPNWGWGSGSHDNGFWGSDSHDDGGWGRFCSSGNDDGLSSDGDHDNVGDDFNMCLDDLISGSSDFDTLLDDWGSDCECSAEGSDGD